MGVGEFDADRVRQRAFVTAAGRRCVAVQTVIDCQRNVHIPGRKDRDVLRGVVDRSRVVVSRRAAVRLVARARNGRRSAIDAACLAHTFVQLFMFCHALQMAVGEFADQRGVVRNEVTRHTVHGVGDEVDGVTTRTFVIQGADTGGIQRAVHAIGQLGTDCHGIEYPGKAQARQLHTTWVDDPIRAQRRFDLRSQPGLVVVELTVVNTESRFDCLDVELAHYPPVLAITAEFGVLTLQSCPVGGQWQLIRAFEQRIRRTEIGAPVRNSSGLPFIEVLSSKRKAIGDLRLGRNLSDRQEHFLGFDTRAGGGFYTITGCLGVRHGVRAEEQALAPIVGMAARLHVDRDVTDFEVAPEKRIEDFTRRTVHVAIHFIAVSVVVITGREAWDVTLNIVVGISMVIPTGGTEARPPVVQVRKIELTQHIEAICHNIAFIELSVRLVEVRCVHDAAVLPVGPHAQVVADRIVPTHAVVGVRHVERGCHQALRTANHQQCERTLSQYLPTLFGLLFHTHYPFIFIFSR
ncbi:hypothetical protein D9M71_255760 [compost metagenome]